MTEYDFISQYSKGEDRPSDYLSRNALSSFDVFSEDIPKLQALDCFCSSILAFLDNGTQPSDGKQATYVKAVAPSCFLEHGQLWRMLQRHGMPTRMVLIVPRELTPQLIDEAHGQILTGHDGIFKAKEILLCSYFWPNMDADISAHIVACSKCQARKKIRHYATPPHSDALADRAMVLCYKGILVYI